MKLVWTELCATFVVKRPFRMPSHSGAMLRSMLAQAVERAASGSSGAPSSSPGAIAGAAPGAERARIAARLFEPAAGEGARHPLLAGQKAPPGRVVILSPPPAAADLAADQEWGVGLRLFGAVGGAEVSILEDTLSALEDVPIGVGDGRIELHAMTRFAPRTLEVAPGCAWSGRVDVRFETPARLRRGGRALEAHEVDFAALFGHTARRLATMCALHGSIDEDDEAALARLCEAARFIRAVDRGLRATHWYQPAAGTGELRPQSGLVGHVMFEGNLGPFLPMLRAGELTHVGSGATLGLGRIALEATARSRRGDGAAEGAPAAPGEGAASRGAEGPGAARA